MLKYLDNSIEEDTVDNSLGDNMLGDNSLAYINNNIDMDTGAKSNPDKEMTGSNFLEENSGISIENLFQRVQEQTTSKRLTRNILKQTCRFF